MKSTRDQIRPQPVNNGQRVFPNVHENISSGYYGEYVQAHSPIDDLNSQSLTILC